MSDTPVSGPVDLIDRISPTWRPLGWPVGYMAWRHLLFLHWPMPAEALRPLVPSSLQLDLHEGVAYVGLVPFTMKDVRPALVPPPLGINCLETNVRTYVHVDGRDPGVYFFSLDAGSLLAVVGARATLGLPYFLARGRFRRRGSLADYELQRIAGGQPRLRVRYEVGDYIGPSRPGTLEHFLLERYLLHVEHLGMLLTVQIHHHPYPVRRARVLDLEDQLIAADGLPEPAGPPPLVHYAAGVDVDTFAPRRADHPGSAQ